MDKKEYIANQLKKTFGKKYENYCVTRIINKLDNLNVRFITQQMFKRDGEEIALADLYFPQVNVWVEIDESQHLNQAEEDRVRTQEVIKNNIRTKLKNLEEVVHIELEEPERINIFDKNRIITIEEINKRIDDIVEKINARILELGDRFVPWVNVYNTADEFIKKQSIEKNDNAKFRTLQDVSELFNKGYRGNQLAYFNVSKEDNEYAWCPKLKLNEDDFKDNLYDNEISDDGVYIFESSKEKNDKFVSDALKTNEKRFVFAKYKDETGDFSYNFLGVYILDRNKTMNLNKRAWKKIDNKISLNKYFY